MTSQTNDNPPANQTAPASGDEDDDSITAIHASAKRRIASLEDQLSNLKEAVTKRKCDVVSNVTQGRAICRLATMFEPVDDLVEENDRRLSFEDTGDLPPFTLQENRTFRGYVHLLKHIPSMKKNLLELEFYELQLYFRELRKGSSGARGDDAANLKPAVVNWVATLFEGPFPSKLLPTTTKSDRGFEHDYTGRLLCPIDYDWEDPSVRKNIRDGHPEFIVTADSWPAFLYPHARRHDDGNVEHGLFQSAILLKAFKFIFTSPTSAQDIDSEKDVSDQAPPLKKHARRQKAPTRGNIANILGMKSVNPRSIAYIAVQLRFSLSNAESWNENDGCFSYPEFYNNVVDYFEDTPGPTVLAEVTKLLSWWTSKVFGGHLQAFSQGQARSGASVSRLAMQRAARESQL